MLLRLVSPMRRSNSSVPYFLQRIPADVRKQAAGITLNVPLGQQSAKHLCRMMRVSSGYHSVGMGGMLIDTLAYQFIEFWPHKDKSFLYHDFLARDFFLFLSSQNPAQSFWRAPGSNTPVARKGSHMARETPALKPDQAWTDRFSEEGRRRCRSLL